MWFIATDKKLTIILIFSQKIIKKFSLNDSQKIIIFSLLWLVFELLRSNLFSGFAWNLIGYIWLVSDNLSQLSAIFGMFAGVYHWFPKMFGKMYSEGLARASFVFIFIGFNVTFFPQFILGAMGMPRRYFDYIPAYEQLNKLSIKRKITLFFPH